MHLEACSAQLHSYSGTMHSLGHVSPPAVALQFARVVDVSMTATVSCQVGGLTGCSMFDLQAF